MNWRVLSAKTCGSRLYPQAAARSRSDRRRRLAWQPTLSRFEHTATPRALYQLGEAVADVVIAHHRRRRRRRARRITIGLKLTEDAARRAAAHAVHGLSGGWLESMLSET